MIICALLLLFGMTTGLDERMECWGGGGARDCLATMELCGNKVVLDGVEDTTVNSKGVARELFLPSGDLRLAF